MSRTIHGRLSCFVYLWICGAVAYGLLTSTATAEDPSPMNILFIAVDDLNDWVDVHGKIGHPQTLTPNLDKLAARGVYFTNAHTAVDESLIPQWLR